MSTYRIEKSTGAFVPRRQLRQAEDRTGALAVARIPSMPQLGLSESHYTGIYRRAERDGDALVCDAAKVGQYLTLARDPHLSWPRKLKYFCHALNRHCIPPEWPDESVWLFYQSLANLVREQAGHEALRLASAEDDIYATRLGLGATREKIDNDAEHFFAALITPTKPEWLNEGDYRQLLLIRDQWI